MSVRTKPEFSHGVFYCTFTCHKWLPLFETVQIYDHIYSWFDFLNSKDIRITGFVIMPNHMHLILYLPPGQVITKVISNAKRFMAYEIVKRLKKLNQVRVLAVLKDGVNPHDQKNGKLHQVFEPSFDIKPCYTLDFIDQKLQYIHRNPVEGKWALVEDFVTYEHSSAAFYELGQPSGKITHAREIVEMIEQE